MQDMIAATLNIDLARARLVEGYLRLVHPTPEEIPPEMLRQEYDGGISATIDSDLAGAESLANSFGL